MNTLLVLVALCASSCAGEYWVQLEVPPMPPVIHLPDSPNLFTNGPMRRGAFSFKNIQLIGWDKAKLNFSFNPETFVVREIYDADSFELKADYSANIEHFDKNGLGTSLHGNGSFHVIYSDYHILGAYYPVKWCTVSRKFQLEYPDYSARIGAIKGHITGLKNARTGEEITLQKFVSMSNSFQKPVFLETYRAIANANIKRGVEKALGTTLLHSFLGLQ